MKIKRFTIENYRSITKAYQININELTVFIGKNNEGKSNVVKALATAVQMLKVFRSNNIRNNVSMRVSRDLYNWESDFPVKYQQSNNKTKKTKTNFRLDFELNEKECDDIYELIHSRINGDLSIDIKITKNNIPEFYIPKRGKNTKVLSSKSKEICTYISRKMIVKNIPAIRSESQAIEVIDELIDTEIQIAAEDEEYQTALDIINAKQQTALDNLSKRIITPLKKFLPTIKKVVLNIENDLRMRGLRRGIDVKIDDGYLTSIKNKGDGVKSLFSIAMLSEIDAPKSSVIITLDEPENHLHPSAIHFIRDVLVKMSEKHQVIISTHNPLLVNRRVINSNIIVDGGKAEPAKNIDSIRKILGVIPSDNLLNANFVLLVEGEDDKQIFTKLFNEKSIIIKKALASNVMTITPMGGATRLNYFATTLLNSMCSFVVLLDNDEAGKQAYNNAIKEGLISDKNARHLICKGLRESEIEDIINPKQYETLLQNNYGISIDCDDFNKRNAKWSDRISAVMQLNGIIPDEEKKKEIKELVSKNISGNYDDIVLSHRSDFIEKIIQLIEAELNNYV